ncbi:MAG: ATP-dependent DNA helicase RecG [Gemmatimonadota bacterium]|nr:ATP-dependent DNA helicase RecG [Gemmatimonadota bacterium]MDE2985300.1 ATP-dependent DNA helicase RecG [Gemmatimonadota bacterium]
MSLTPLDKPVQFLKGVGPRRAEAFQRLGIVCARDLLHHVPRRYDDASTITPLARVEVGMDVTAVGMVKNKGIVPTRSGLRIFQAVLQDGTGIVTCAWPGQPWLDRTLQVGDRILVTGPVKFFHGRQIQPREHAVLERASTAPSPTPTPGPQSPATPQPAPTPPGTIFVTYPASEQLPQWVLRRVISLNLEQLLRHVGDEDHLTPSARRALGLPDLASAFATLHRPPSLDRVDAATRRLAYDELFFLQLLQARVRYHATRARPGIAFERTNELIRALHDSLPFTLTGAQVGVLREIYADMASPHRMNRMLQGDVGCGKTLVALFAMLLAVEGGYQAALMAPTEILAEQHAARIREFLAGLPCGVELLTGSATGRRREEARARVAGGEARVVIGTHALIQEGVEFDALGLVVVDEQHRFGVRQRLALAERDPAPDVLVMSATPIPRSLAMALHGDLDISMIDELPAGRRPVATRVAGPEKREEVFREVGRRLDRGEQAYVVYPVIEESEKAELRAAETEYDRLRSGEFAGREVALLHGRMPADEKDRVMRAFLAGEIRVLVATTVIEVGIDVANATVMVIENAERFGLSQLHQLRGRVGRGDRGGLCVVIPGGTGSSTRERLAVFARTSDGFEIAAADLRIRGQGDFFGAEQHGHGTGLRFADILVHGDLVGPARERARGVVDGDPEVAKEENALLRLVLERRYGERLKLFGVG